MKTYVIIGASAAGYAAWSTLARLDPAAEIICITKEEKPYNKCLLTTYLTSTRDIALPFIQNTNRHLLTNTCVTGIDSHSKRVILDSGETIAYDSLLLATGSTPCGVPSTMQGIFSFHALADVRRIKEYKERFKVTEAVVVGAGFTGLECADALSSLGIRVWVIEQKEHILPYALSQASASWLTNHLQRQGIMVITQNTLVAYLEKEGRIVGVELGSKERIRACLVVYALGSRPATELASEAGINVKDGLLVNSQMQTSNTAIYAAGDCICVRDIITGLFSTSSTWPEALKQGMIAAYNMAGQYKEYPGFLKMYVSSLGGLPVIACGQTLGIAHEENAQAYCSTLFVDEDERIKGFTFIGESKKIGYLKKAVELHKSINEVTEELDV
jgi:nitrite reductase (NADH) large subunit